MSDPHCECLEKGPSHYRETAVGVDETKGRFGHVSIRSCHACKRRWLYYEVEYEAFTGSGRWYAGLLDAEPPDGITPESAVPLLRSLPWHISGGPYFGGHTRKGSGPISVDL